MPCRIRDQIHGQKPKPNHSEMSHSGQSTDRQAEAQGDPKMILVDNGMFFPNSDSFGLLTLKADGHRRADAGPAGARPGLGGGPGGVTAVSR